MDIDVKELETVGELEKALAESDKRPVLLFKHSTTCPISSRALSEFNSYLENADPAVSYNMVTVQRARKVSNEAAAKLRVRHETPQAILIRNGHEVWNASHFEITREALELAIRQSAR